MRYVIRFLFRFQFYVKNNCLAMSTFIHKISIGTESVILLCTYGCSLEGAKEVMFVEGREGGDSCNGKSLHILHCRSTNI